MDENNSNNVVDNNVVEPLSEFSIYVIGGAALLAAVPAALLVMGINHVKEKIRTMKNRNNKEVSEDKGERIAIESGND